MAQLLKDPSSNELDMLSWLLLLESASFPPATLLGPLPYPFIFTSYSERDTVILLDSFSTFGEVQWTSDHPFSLRYASRATLGSFLSPLFGTTLVH